MLGVITITMLIFSFICFYIYFKFKKMLHRNTNDSFMLNEASRIIFKDAEVKAGYSSQGRVYCRGLALIKSENGKYTLIPQAKVCDIGLY